jgi:excisionase family DNA binding protein
MIQLEGVTMYTIQEAAAALKVTAQTVRAYVKSGKLTAKRVGRPYMISGESLRSFLLGSSGAIQGASKEGLSSNGVLPPLLP